MTEPYEDTLERDRQAVANAFADQQRVYREEQRPALENILRCRREREESADISRLTPAEACRVILQEWVDTFGYGPAPEISLPTEFNEGRHTESRRFARQRGSIMVCRGSGVQHYKGVG